MPNLYIISGCNGAGKPEDTIIRRYQGGLTNFFKIYQPICDTWVLVNNMYPDPIFVAKGSLAKEERVYDEFLWNKIKTRWT